MSEIKRAISLYSFQEAIYFKKLDLEDTLAACADMGAKGVEIIPDQSIREFPNISDDFIDKWHGMMERYGLTPTCMDDFVETRLYKHRTLSEDDHVERFIKAVKLAKKLGCFIIREQFALGEELMTVSLLEKCLPYAEKYDVIIGMEVHGPNYLGNPQIEDYLRVMEKSPYAALIVDFSIFMHTIPSIIIDHYLRKGARREVLEYANNAYKNRVPVKEALAGARKFNLTPVEEDFFDGPVKFNCYIEPEVMKDYMPYTKYFHGKTFGVSEDLVDDCIDVPRVVKVIRDAGFKGYIATELEGNRYVHDTFEYDCIEQTWRHQQLLAKVLGE
jgi:sugar phosphate isomerase/epimerase